MNGATPNSALTPPADLAALGAWLDRLIEELAEHPDAAVGERVSALLDGVDALHRAALGRLATYLREPAGAAIWARARRDPIVAATLTLYDLLPRAERERAEVALAAVRSFAASRGETLRLRDVTGGKVTVVAAGSRQGPVPPLGELQRMLERALVEQLEGFRESVIERQPGAPAARAPNRVAASTAPPRKRELPVTAAAQVAPTPPPLWREVATLEALVPDRLIGLRAEDEGVLLCAMGEAYAYRDVCPDNPPALSFGGVEAGAIVFPWHGCRFDPRTVRRLGQRGAALARFDVDTVGPIVRVSVRAPTTLPPPQPAIAIEHRS